MLGSRLLDGLLAVGGAPDHRDVVLQLQHGDQPMLHHRMVIRDEHADHAVFPTATASVSGTRAVTVVPLPGAPTTVSEPPAFSTRSRMPTMPKLSLRGVLP